MHQARLPLVPEGTRSFRLVGATVVDGTGSNPLPDGEIEVRGSRLEYVGPRRSATAPDGSDDRDDDVVTVDVAGRTVLPGFIDTHVHLSVDLETPPAVTQSRWHSERVLVAAGIVRSTLMAGVTTARDLAGLDAGYRRAVQDGMILGPRLHLAIAALSPTGGHTDFHLPNGVPVRPFDDSPVSSIIDTDDDVRRTVRLLVRSGADVIKVCTTGGVSSPSDTPHDLGVPERHVRMIVEETGRRSGQPVAAHAQGTDGILEAIRGGVTSVEHGYEIDKQGIDLMLEKDVFLVPTLSSALRVPSPADVPSYLYEKKTRWSGIAREHVAEALQAGVKVALGTDSGVCPHGRNLTELGHMVDLGMSPMAAVVAGTRNAAQLLGLADHLGTLEDGKLADLVVTDVDPLADPHALADPDAIGVVVQGGRAVKDLGSWLPFPVERAVLG